MSSSDARSVGPAALDLEARTAPLPLIDWAALDLQYEGRPEFRARLLSAFSSGYATLASEFECADVQGGDVRLSALLHRLRGASSYVMAKRLEASATRAEFALQRGLPTAAELLVEVALVLRSTLAEVVQSSPRCPVDAAPTR
jgi:hypothetical protein